MKKLLMICALVGTAWGASGGSYVEFTPGGNNVEFINETGRDLYVNILWPSDPFKTISDLIQNGQSRSIAIPHEAPIFGIVFKDEVPAGTKPGTIKQHQIAGGPFGYDLISGHKVILKKEDNAVKVIYKSGAPHRDFFLTRPVTKHAIHSAEQIVQ